MQEQDGEGCLLPGLLLEPQAALITSLRLVGLVEARAKAKAKWPQGGGRQGLQDRKPEVQLKLSLLMPRCLSCHVCGARNLFTSLVDSSLLPTTPFFPIGSWHWEAC